MEFDRRSFITAAGAIGIAARLVRAEAETTKPSVGKEVKSKIRVAQIKVYPEKGNIKANYDKLMTILGILPAAAMSMSSLRRKVFSTAMSPRKNR